LTEITIPIGVTRIDDSAFSGCSGLTGITIPSGVIHIGYYAFEGCSGLTEITIQRLSSSGRTTLGQYAFRDCNVLTSIYVPDSASVTAYKAAGNWSAYAALIKTA
jgi:hypothetical protein